MVANGNQNISMTSEQVNRIKDSRYRGKILFRTIQCNLLAIAKYKFCYRLLTGAVRRNPSVSAI
jgi:hypothetical protein